MDSIAFGVTMSEPRNVTRWQVREDPYLVWNEYVGLLAMSNYRDLTETQRAAHLVFWYEHEVQNGGHLQYFENRGSGQVGEVIGALRRLGAHCQAQVLSRAAAQFAASPRAKIESVEEFVQTALEGEFAVFDQEFYACQPNLVEVLEAFLKQNRPAFVLVVD
jgi:uncharacterized protein DUF4375